MYTRLLYRVVEEEVQEEAADPGQLRGRGHREDAPGEEDLQQDQLRGPQGPQPGQRDQEGPRHARDVPPVLARRRGNARRAQVGETRKALPEIQSLFGFKIWGGRHLLSLVP